VVVPWVGELREQVGTHRLPVVIINRLDLIADLAKHIVRGQLKAEPSDNTVFSKSVWPIECRVPELEPTEVAVVPQIGLDCLPPDALRGFSYTLRLCRWRPIE